MNITQQIFSDIYTYIYCHSQTDCVVVSQLFSVARHVGCLKLGSKPAQLYGKLSIIPLSQQANHVSPGIISCSFSLFTFLYLTGYQSAQFVRRALHYEKVSVYHSYDMAIWEMYIPWPLRYQRIYIYIYIYNDKTKYSGDVFFIQYTIIHICLLNKF